MQAQIVEVLTATFYAYAARFLRVVLAESEPGDPWAEVKRRWALVGASERAIWAAKPQGAVNEWFGWYEPGCGPLWKGPSCVGGGKGVVVGADLAKDLRVGEYRGRLVWGQPGGDYAIQCEPAKGWHIDGAQGGNWTRWVQHGFKGRAANLRLVVTGQGTGRGGGRKGPGLQAYLETMRVICRGEELFWEYGTTATLADWFVPAPQVSVKKQLSGDW